MANTLLFVNRHGVDITPFGVFARESVGNSYLGGVKITSGSLKELITFSLVGRTDRRFFRVILDPAPILIISGKALAVPDWQERVLSRLFQLFSSDSR